MYSELKTVSEYKDIAIRKNIHSISICYPCGPSSFVQIMPNEYFFLLERDKSTLFAGSNPFEPNTRKTLTECKKSINEYYREKKKQLREAKILAKQEIKLRIKEAIDRIKDGEIPGCWNWQCNCDEEVI